MMRRYSYPVFAMAAACASPAMGQSFADLSAIDREVAAFIGVNPNAPDGAFAPVDRRMKLAACNRPLNLTWMGNRRQTVMVQCPTPGGWKLYVPIYAASVGQAIQPVISRGDAVSVTLSGPGFSVSQSAEALEAGAVGEWIRVRVGKDTELRAQVIRPGAVGMDLP
jgi:flagella basal body P-ring formation protein FlgA